MSASPVFTVVWLMGMLSSTWICAGWLFITTSDGADIAHLRAAVIGLQRVQGYLRWS